MANPTLAAGRAKTISVVINDKKGNPASVDGMPQWSSSDDALVSLTPSEDGMSATVVSLGATGTVQISVSADADMGEGVRTMTGSALIDVMAGEAFAFALMLGEDFDPAEPAPEEPTEEEPVDETPVDEPTDPATPDEPVDPDAPIDPDAPVTPDDGTTTR